jgi:hypothetical protein
MQPHKRIEDEQPRPEPADGLLKALAVGLQIEPNGGRGDDLNVEIPEEDAGGGADPLEPTANDLE